MGDIGQPQNCQVSQENILWLPYVPHGIKWNKSSKSREHFVVALCPHVMKWNKSSKSREHFVVALCPPWDEVE
jgi:hypothetical protein